MGLMDCLPKPIVAGAISAYITFQKRRGGNVFTFESNGCRLWYEYTDLRTFSFFYNALRGDRTKENIPIELFDVPDRVDAVLDLGAHFGLYTVLLGALNHNIPIHAFEPIPYNADVLRRNIERNNLDVEVHQAAVNSSGGRVQMRGGNKIPNGLRFYEDTIGSRIVDDKKGVGADGTILSQGAQLSKFLNNHDIRDPFIKIDIEGAEYGVVRDLLDNANIDSLSGFLELHPGMCHGGDAHEILFWLEANDIAFELVKDYTPSRPGYHFTTHPQEIDDTNAKEWMEYLRRSVT